MGILVGDIGGTKTGLALAHLAAGQSPTLSLARRYPSGDFDSLGALIDRYVSDTGARFRYAALAVAGPVHDDRSKTTNLPWDVDARQLAERFALTGARLLNDLEAVAWGIPALGPTDLAVLHPGETDATGNACVIAAGTGLGEAGLYWDGARHHPFATEGGHTSFAPAADERELALLRFLADQLGHVSWERVVSGMGIANLYAFLLAWRDARTPDWLAEAMTGDAAGAIATAAAEQRCPLCAETMELFARLYGREAGNLALKHMALGGVYLGGGIAPKNLDLLRAGGFLAAFFDKGRMAPLMRRMPVMVVLEPQVALVGAAAFLRQAQPALDADPGAA